MGTRLLAEEEAARFVSEGAYMYPGWRSRPKTENADLHSKVK